MENIYSDKIGCTAGWDGCILYDVDLTTPLPPAAVHPRHHLRLRLRLQPVLDGLRVSEAELARRMGTTRQHVNGILTREADRVAGVRGRGVSLETVDRIALALGVDPLVLLDVSILEEAPAAVPGHE